MAVRYYAVTHRAAHDKVRHGFDGIDDTKITRRDELRRALEGVLRTLEGSDALSS